MVNQLWPIAAVLVQVMSIKEELLIFPSNGQATGCDCSQAYRVYSVCGLFPLISGSMFLLFSVVVVLF